jgi:hypothetical protein
VLTAAFTGAGSHDAAPSGAVTFSAASGAFSGQSCTPSGDVLTCTVSYSPSGTLAVGTYNNYLTASIAAGGDYKAASASANLMVAKQVTSIAGFSCTPNSLTQGQSTTCSGTLLSGASGISGQTIAFSAGWFPEGSTMTGSGGSFSIKFDPPTRSDAITASYAGNGNYDSSSATYDVTLKC